MKKLLKRWAFLLTLVATMTGCTGCTAIKQAKALKDCKYSYSKIDQVGLMGFSNIRDLASIQGAFVLAQALSGKANEVPLTFTLHLNVDNPNEGTAAIERLYYKVYLDSLQVADGSTTQSFSVVGGSRSDLALPLRVDLANLLKSDQRQAVTKIVKSFAGMEAEPTQVQIDLKPTLKIGNRTLTSPKFIPIKFQYPTK